MLLKVNPENPQIRHIERIADILSQGGIIAYPTDTFYGIGCDILNKKAIQRVYQLKQRKPLQPFSFICADLKNISEYAKVTNYQYKMLNRLLPGPYTFILEGSRQVPKIMLTKRKTAGIRVPDSAIPICLVQALGNPIISTTATTPDGKHDFLDPSLLLDYYKGQIDCVIDGGPVPGKPSSVISLINDTPEVIRAGLGDTSLFE
ncbi:MAG: L-threonylcarbamoyladenylate synthase [Desulfatibacillaceae bacterium]|nr:L-threonylcarbamoyladenylate synthase [Desulfatibacillaceae bacterium]